ncbi:unnamed protein product, partial [Laminaria digitata]
MHLNEEYAGQTMFAGTIAHGMLCSSFISTVVGTRLPGPGCVYVSQTLKFKAPVRPGDTVTARATVTELVPGKNRAILETICTVGDKVVISGEAQVLVPQKNSYIAPMRILRHFTGVPAADKGAVIALGNFDGLHRGHQHVIATARDIARADGRKFGILTFEPHPRTYFGKESEPFRLTPFRIKVRELQALGADLLFVLRFDGSIAKRPADSFVTDILHEGIGASHVVVGYDFAFGAGREGNPEYLAARAEELGFRASAVQPARDEVEEIYSSTLIRKYLQNGQP